MVLNLSLMNLVSDIETEVATTTMAETMPSNKKVSEKLPTLPRMFSAIDAAYSSMTSSIPKAPLESCPADV